MKRILNVTNGDCFNDYFLSNFGGEALPFREMMMDGDAVIPIYSDSFVRLRAEELNISPEQYRADTLLFDALQKNCYTAVHLWFGKDTFCQMNLLTLLAYLEQIQYPGEVILNYVDDETFQVLEDGIRVSLGVYQKLYESILVNKKLPQFLGVLVPRSIRLYFDYLSKDGFLQNLVKQNLQKEKTALIALLLKNSAEYGLSDLQAEKLICSILRK